MAESTSLNPTLGTAESPASSRIDSQSSWRSALFFVLLTSTATVIPMLFHGNISGHDFRFHLESWMDVAGQWRQGILFPRWAEWANWGFGEPRFIFYPPLSWLIGAALGSVLPWTVAPEAYIWIVLTLAGMSMWRLARQWLSHPYAVVAAALYVVNPYHLVIIYYRSAFGELLAAALLPLLIGVALRTIEGGWRYVPALAFVFASVWLSNAPAAVIATYSLAITLVAGSIFKRGLQPLIAGLGGMAGGFGLAAFYILPAALEQRWVQIAESVSSSYRPSVNFLFSRANDPDFVAFNWKVSWVATALIIATIIAAIVAAKGHALPQLPLKIACVLALVATALMLPPSLWLWRTLPKLWFIQFPWRWLDIVTLVFALFAAATIAALRITQIRWAFAVVLFGAIFAAGTVIVRDGYWDTGDVTDIVSAIHNGRGYEGTDEYAPLGCDRLQLPGNPDDSERPSDVSADPAPRVAKLDTESGDVVPAAGVRLHPQRWTSTDKILTAESEQQATLAPRLVNYPAWDLTVNGKPAKIAQRAETTQILVTLPAGKNQVEIRFRQTWDRTAGDVISAVAVATLGAFGWYFRRRKIAESARA